jgi:tetraacyldisaccharide 4'-kinase
MNHARLYDIMAGKDRGVLGHAAALGLSAMEPGYRLAVALRNRLFDLGLRKPVQLPRPTVSVGNLTTGGTGKTPMVIELARRLAEQGSRPAVLLRGYMADQNGSPSDEALELARELGSSVPVQPDPDRAAAAGRVVDKHPAVTVFLLDDGFQHRQVHRDLDIVLIDATRPLGFGRLLPRGLLREPAGNLRRADAVIVTRCDLVTPAVLADLDQRIKDLTGQPPTAHTACRWSGFRGPAGDLPADHLRTLHVVGISAIGNPQAFKQMLNASAGRVLQSHTFDDHHAYSSKEVQGLLADAQRLGAQAVVTTEKDWVKWQPLLESLNPSDRAHRPPILRPVLGAEFLDGAGAIDRMLRELTQRAGGHPRVL